MKKYVIPFLAGLVFLIAIALTGCGEPPLQKAYEEMNALESSYSEVFYDSSKDILQVSLYDSADLDAVFEKLDEAVKDQKLGGIFFRTKFTTDSNFIKDYDKKISELPCKSLSMLAVSTEVAEYSRGLWTKLAPKSEIIYIPGIWSVSHYKGEAEENLKKVEKLWMSNDGFQGIKMFPKVREIGIAVDIDMDRDPSKEGEESSSESTDITSGSGDDQSESTSDSSTDADEQESEETEPAYVFDPTFDGAEYFTPLRVAKNLDHILIAPTSSSYTINANGAGYIYALSNVCPNVKINAPDKELSEDNLIKIRDVDISDLTYNGSYLKDQILEGFLKPETKKCYKKGIKFRESSKVPRIRGKALVYMASPDSSDWHSSRRYYENGEILGKDQLKNKVSLPERSRDYQTFIYAYPVYSYKAMYTSGTKGYTETYKVQVFDLKKKIKYKAQTVASEDPPQSFRYQKGYPPEKYGGSVDDEKVYKFIRKIRKR